MGVNNCGFCLNGNVILLFDNFMVFSVMIISNIIRIIVNFIVIFVNINS